MTPPLRSVLALRHGAESADGVGSGYSGQDGRGVLAGAQHRAGERAGRRVVDHGLDAVDEHAHDADARRR